MSKMNLARIFGVSVVALCVTSCGPTVSTNVASTPSEEEMSIDEFLGLLAESDDELAELGLKKKKKKDAPKEKRNKAESRAREAVVPVTDNANDIAQKKEQIKKKNNENKKNNPAKAAEDKKPENKKKSLVQKAKIKQEKLAKKVKQQGKKIGASEKKARNLNKRIDNLGAAMVALRDVRKLPNKGLPEILAKCKAIRDAKTMLKETNSPKRPFDGSRKGFLSALDRQRNIALKASGVVSCGAARNLAAGLPPTAPVPEDVADEEISDVYDAIDQMPVEQADLEDYETVEAELDAELEAEAEMVEAGMDIGMDADMDPMMNSESSMASDTGDSKAGGDGSGCVISQADGTKIYSSLSATEAACKTTCTALEASVPQRNCSFNGVVFSSVPMKSCVITSASGSLLFNAQSGAGDCQMKCNGFSASAQGTSCSWNGEDVSL